MQKLCKRCANVAQTLHNHAFYGNLRQIGVKYKLFSAKYKAKLLKNEKKLIFFRKKFASFISFYYFCSKIISLR